MEEEIDSASSDSSDEEEKGETNKNGASSSSDSSGTDEEEEIDEESKIKAEVEPANNDENSSDSGSSEENSSDSSTPQTKAKKKKQAGTKQVWEENPDIYGIRRSSRARKEPERLKIESGNSGSDSDSIRGKKKLRGRKKSDSWIPTLSGSESEETDSSFEAPVKTRKNKVINQRSSRGRKGGRRQQRGRPADYSSSEEEYGAKKKGRKKKTGTASLRNSNKVSYKEDSEEETDSDDIIEQDDAAAAEPEEDVETIEKIVRHRKGRKGETGAQTTMYAVEAEDLAARGEADPEKDETDKHYLIKWKGWSHLHNTWESETSLKTQKAKGMKKLENYIKRVDEIEQWKKIASVEDIEYFECQQEMSEEIQKQCQQAERIVAHQFSPDSTSSYPDYLCKWQGLPYSECTWEDGTLTARFFQNLIDEYLERERSDTIPNKNAKCLRHRPKFVSFKKQPSYVGSDELRLRDYQLDGLNWLVHAWCRETSVILSDEMGLGKTIQTISFLSYLFHTHHLYGPFLVVVPLSTMDSWQREFGLWGPSMNVIVYIGDVNSRTMIQQHEWCFKKSKKLKFNVVLTTYEMLLRDKDLLGSLYWACLMVDEAHRLKNDDSLLYRVLVDFRTNFRLLITGTPLQNSLKELWSLMHFIMPNKFDSWEDFEELYSIQDREGLQKLHRDLEPYLLRRVKKDVEKSLPAKVEQILRVEMSLLQKQYYKLILTKNVKELCKELKGSFSGLLNIIVELKKCCNHANLIKPLDPTNPDPNLLQTLIRGSGKMILLDKLLCRLKEKGHRVLIFSQMVRMLDVIADYLYLKRFQFQRLDGSIRGEQRKRALDHFNAEGSQDFCFLLSTRAGGLGINLASADTVIIFDSDWNPQNDLQAMARAHRIGQKNQVNIYRFVTKNTIEEDIIERAKKKMVLDHLIIQRMDTTGRRILSKSKTAPNSNAPFNKEELSSILKFGAEELFKDHDQEADQKLQAMDIDEILKRAETQDSHEGSTSMGEELLSQFKVVNYEAFNEEEIKPEPSNPMQKLWEEIIPEDERKKAEEEEERMKKENEVLKPRSRKAVEKMNISLHTSSNKKIKSKAIVDTDFSSSSDSDDIINDTTADDKVKKSSVKKPIKTTKEGVKGFTDNELRKFIKSYKKFARPLTRLDSIAEDAELTDKSASDLIDLAQYLKTSCEQAVEEYQQKLLEDEQFDGRKKGATLKMSGVSINAPSVLKAEKDLEPLAICVPADTKQQKSYRLTVPTRSVHWGVPWGVVEDSMLLAGMLVYGVGNWEAIKNDPSLTLSTKILPVGNGKPQDKHLHSRAEYLLKVLKEQCNQKETKKEPKKKKSKSKQAPDNTNTDIDAKPQLNQEKDTKNDIKKEKAPKKDKKEKRKEKKKKPVAVMAEVNILVEDFRDMDEEKFKKCKEKLRPERKSLQQLQTPDEEASEQDQIKTTKKCLLNIGDHIEKCLNDYQRDEKELNMWRSYLWSFVARFTEFPPSKLFSLYRTACRKREERRKEVQRMKSNYTNTLHEIGKHAPPDRLELEEARKRALGMDLSSPAKKIPKLDRIKIPHRKKEGEETPQGNRPRYSTPQSHHSAGKYGQENNFRHKDHFQKRPYKRHQQQFDYRTNPQQRNVPEQKLRHDSRPKIEPSNSGQFQTYREWKESQKNKSGIPKDEKPAVKTKIFDEKPHKVDKQASSYDSRNKQRVLYNKDRDNVEREPGELVSPTFSSPNASNSPHHYYGDRYSRKRTSSNNSDFTTALKKVQPESESSNSRQSWSQGGGGDYS